MSRTRGVGGNFRAGVEPFICRRRREESLISSSWFETRHLVSYKKTFERANNIPYGLSAGVWTDKVIFKRVNKLRAGVIWANTYNKFDPTSPFGGYKESGFGREGGLQGLAAYCHLV